MKKSRSYEDIEKHDNKSKKFFEENDEKPIL